MKVLDDIWGKLIQKRYWKSILFYCITELFKPFFGNFACIEKL